MVRCFVTGVQFPLDKGFVLNRREARSLLAALNDRVASLRRVIDQLAPLDDDPAGTSPGSTRQGRFAPRKHRLVCKAVAGAMASGFAEIDLFVEWPEYQSQASAPRLPALRAHRRFGEAISKLDSDTLLEADKLGRVVLRLLDPHRALPKNTRTAIAASTCVNHRNRKPEQVVQLLRDAATGVGDAASAGIAAHELGAVRKLLQPNPKERLLERADEPTPSKDHSHGQP